MRGHEPQERLLSSGGLDDGLTVSITDVHDRAPVQPWSRSRRVAPRPRVRISTGLLSCRYRATAGDVAARFHRTMPSGRAHPHNIQPISETGHEILLDKDEISQRRTITLRDQHAGSHRLRAREDTVSLCQGQSLLLSGAHQPRVTDVVTSRNRTAVNQILLPCAHPVGCRRRLMLGTKGQCRVHDWTLNVGSSATISPFEPRTAQNR